MGYAGADETHYEGRSQGISVSGCGLGSKWTERRLHTRYSVLTEV